MHATKALQNGENPPEIYVSDGSMAERVGFEPTEGVSPQLISSQSRCDHFDTAPGYFHPDFRPGNWREKQERKREILTHSMGWKP